MIALLDCGSSEVLRDGGCGDLLLEESLAVVLHIAARPFCYAGPSRVVLLIETELDGLPYRLFVPEGTGTERRAEGLGARPHLQDDGTSFLVNELAALRPFLAHLRILEMECLELLGWNHLPLTSGWIWIPPILPHLSHPGASGPHVAGVAKPVSHLVRLVVMVDLETSRRPTALAGARGIC